MRNHLKIVRFKRDITREEFKSLLPQTIKHERAVLRLEILADNKILKAATYVGERKFKVGYCECDGFAGLYLMVVEYLEKEIF